MADNEIELAVEWHELQHSLLDLIPDQAAAEAREWIQHKAATGDAVLLFLAVLI